jgi:hypothetical protein
MRSRVKKCFPHECILLCFYCVKEVFNNAVPKLVYFLNAFCQFFELFSCLSEIKHGTSFLSCWVPFWNLLYSIRYICCGAAIRVRKFYIPPGGIEFEKACGRSAEKFVIDCANLSTYVGEGTPNSKRGHGGRDRLGI